MQRCQDATSFAAPAGGLLSSAGRHGLFILGGISFAVGAVGLVLPLLPTTIFWIIAAWAWSKSCPRLQQRLYTVPGAGPHVRAWIEEGRISRRGKQFALGGLAFGLATCAWALYATPVILAAAGLPQVIAGFYIASRPE
ncbi:MAG: YbaN family protein [Zoogloea sp.]|nr:YbaN family protein [Zoogloea sp.]